MGYKVWDITTGGNHISMGSSDMHHGLQGAQHHCTPLNRVSMDSGDMQHGLHGIGYQCYL